MKKFLSILLVLTFVLASLAGCGTKAPEEPGDNGETPDPGGSTGFDIVLITDKGNIDDKSFNQGSWEGVVEFAKANDISHQYIKPEDASTDGYLEAIDLAVEAGAKVIVTPGFLFEVPIFHAQTKYPDVKFLLLDGSPHDADYTDFTIGDNVVGLMYAEEESGYLAGYAAVKDGFTHLGFMGGMAVPAVQAFGYGYLQGAEDAAAELGLGDGAIKVDYHYTGDFDENVTNKATAAAMYQGGAEVVFGCGGAVGKSVMSAAAEADAKFIGVDVDQRYDSETTITSATKGLSASVIQALEAIFITDKWSEFGGTVVVFNAENDGVGLPTTVIGEANADAFDRFEKFDKAQYDELFGKLKGGEISVIREIEVAAESGEATAEELTSQLKLAKVKVTTR